VERTSPSVDYVLKIRQKDGDWASKLSSKLDTPIRIRTVSCTSKEFHGRIFVPRKYERIVSKFLRELRRSKAIKAFEIEGNFGKDLSIFISAGEPRVCYRILRNQFELMQPVIVDKNSETYSIRAFGESKSNIRIATLIEDLAKSKISIENIFRELRAPEMHSVVPPVKFDGEVLSVIEKLVEGNYFDKNKRKITQGKISKQLDISVGKVNDIIRYVEWLGFHTLLSIYPDLNKFKSLLHEIMKEDEKQFKIYTEPLNAQ
jgi:predicted DNA binding protein